ncbi:MAG: ATP-binding protein [Bryobacteraceae bacterium]
MRKRRGRKTALLLLTGQFLTIASILLIVSVDDLRTPSAMSLKFLASGACLLGFGVVLVFRRFRLDGARQKQLEQELRSTNEEVVAALTVARDGIEARNQFLTGFSRRMHSPLKEIVRRTATLLETDLTNQQRGCTQTNLLAAESLAAAITNVLDYSQMEAGKLSLKNVEFEPARLIREVVEVFSNRAQRMGLKLNTAIDERLPSLIKGDSVRLQQVLANLLDNALKFTQRGEILVSVSEAGLSEGRTKLKFAVKDTGIGINEQARALLFQLFDQTGGSSIGEGSAIGLGLAISKKLVELMGGAIDVDSKPGRGSVFRFTAVFECPCLNQGHETHSTEVALLLRSATPAATSSPKLATRTNVPAQHGSGRDRRMATRYRVNHPTLLKSKSAGVAVVRVLDVSETGLRVSIPFRLELNTEVEIRVKDKTISGFVRNCVCKAGTEFHVGIEVSEPVSAGRFSFDQVLRRARA